MKELNDQFLGLPGSYGTTASRGRTPSESLCPQGVLTMCGRDILLKVATPCAIVHDRSCFRTRHDTKHSLINCSTLRLSCPDNEDTVEPLSSEAFSVISRCTPWITLQETLFHKKHFFCKKRPSISAVLDVGRKVSLTWNIFVKR